MNKACYESLWELEKQELKSLKPKKLRLTFTGAPILDKDASLKKTHKWKQFNEQLQKPYLVRPLNHTTLAPMCLIPVKIRWEGNLKQVSKVNKLDRVDKNNSKV